MHPELKITAWMEDIVQKFSKPGNLVVDASAGTFSVATACTVLLKHRKVIGCGVDPGCMTEAMLQLILLYARQVLSTESKIDGKGEVRSLAKMYVKAGERWRCETVWACGRIKKALLP